MSGEELADRLMDYDQCNESDVDAAAAELKRLSAELARVSRQRDAAVEALRELLDVSEDRIRQVNSRVVAAWDAARAAIALVEESPK